MGYLILERMSGIEYRVGVVGTQVREIGVQAFEALDVALRAADTAEEALTRAIGAEDNAREAARIRELAEDARRDAESGRAEAEMLAASAAAEAVAVRLEAEQIQQEAEQNLRARQAELDRLERALGEIVETRRTALGLVMNLGTDAIEFDFDRVDLGIEERELLSRIAGVLLTSTDYSVYVYGHTDDVGDDAYNLALSERRAQSVRDYLIASGISPAIFTTRGYGKASPRVEGTSNEARASNRRVEIGIVDVTMDVLGEVPEQQ